MIRIIKKYWVEILVFLAIGGMLLADLAPNLTWINTDSDGPHYTLAAKYLTTAHHMSAPLYLLLGRLFLFIPIGTEAWRMGLMSVLGTMGGVVFIYLILRHLLKDNPKARLYALVSVLVFGGSALVISQSTIIETYTLATMCGIGAYYFALKQKWVWASVILGLGLALHPFLAFIVWAVLFVAFKELRHWRRYGLTILFFAFYLYIPIVTMLGNDLGMWGNTTSKGFFEGTAGMVLMLTGGLAIWDFPKRVLDTVLILVVSFGFGIVPLVWYFIKERTWRSHLLWLVLIPIIYFATDLARETYVYMLPSIAFGAIAIGLGLSRMNIRWALVTCVITVGLSGYNAFYFDIGNQLDPEMSTMKFYNEELVKIPDGEYFMGSGWTWAIVYLYNQEEGRDIVPICMDIFPMEEYLEMLEEDGIRLVRSDAESQLTSQAEVALSIAELNDGVWIARETKPEVFQYVIEPARGNEDYIGRWIGQEIEPGNWQWKPSNPYLFISGQLEVSEWHHILMSNRNMLHIACYGMLGYGLVWLLMQRFRKKKAVDEQK